MNVQAGIRKSSLKSDGLDLEAEMSARQRLGPAEERAEPLRFGEALTPGRRIAGFAIALTIGPLMAWLFRAFHSSESIAVELLSFQLLVVVVAITGGIWPALFAAVLSALTLDLLFIEPHLTVAVANPLHAFILVLHVAIAVLVSIVVGRAERQTQKARRASADAELLQDVAGSVLRGQDAVQALLDRTREAFSLRLVRLAEDGEIIASSGESALEQAGEGFPVDHRTTLETFGRRDLQASEQRLIAVIAAQLAAALEHRRLQAAASEIEPIMASDRVRGALLSALSHDLRKPLAAATAAIGGLRAAGDTLSESDGRELLETAEESLDALTGLVTDLLDVSRVQAGALALSPVAVDPAEVIIPALQELDPAPGAVDLALEHGHGQVIADPVLLQRAVSNLLANAIRFSPPGAAVEISTRIVDRRVEIRIADHGPGVPVDRRDEIFTPFQRLGDTDNTTGLGLGLALSRGFVEAMHGSLEAESTPGGGLTMAVALPSTAHIEEGKPT